VFSSPTRFFNYPTIAGFIDNRTAIIADHVNVPVRIGFVQLQTGSGEINGRLMYGSGSQAACTNNSIYKINAKSGSVWIVEVTPKAIQGRGPGFIDVPVSMTFTTEHDVPPGGKVVFSVSREWEYLCPACIVAGLGAKATCGQDNPNAIADC
jgi:hypothetical protein